jgi:hypothetical protein
VSGRTAKAARREAATRAADLDATLDAIWARIPDAGCKGLCQDCCGPIGMSEVERDRIHRRHGLTIRDAETKPGTLDCPALGSDGACQVYGDRPTVCRLWGSVEALPCPHGCTPLAGRLPDVDSTRILGETLALDGPRTRDHSLAATLAADPDIAPLYARAMRGDRSVYGQLAELVAQIAPTYRDATTR